MSVEIHPMTRADIDDVTNMERTCFRTPWTRGDFVGELKNRVAHYHVLTVDGERVGYGGMWVLYEEAHVTNICVMPAFRRQGLARRLMLSLMHTALALGAESMTLEVRETNLGAQSLYAELGFVQNGRRPRYYSDTGEAALLLWNTDIRKTVNQYNGGQNDETL